MRTYPLKTISLEEALRLQFKVVDCITREFEGQEILSRGDLGVVPGLNKPVTTRKAEKAVAAVFDAEAACFAVSYTHLARLISNRCRNCWTWQKERILHCTGPLICAGILLKR